MNLFGENNKIYYWVNNALLISFKDLTNPSVYTENKRLVTKKQYLRRFSRAFNSIYITLCWQVNHQQKAEILVGKTDDNVYSLDRQSNH